MDEVGVREQRVVHARGLVEELCGEFDAEHAAQVRQVRVIDRLCQAYSVLDAVGPVLPGQERLVPAGADGTPLVAEHLATELAPRLRVSIPSAGSLIAETMDIVYRHPRLWQAVQDGRLRVWQARQIVRATSLAGLCLEAALWVDTHLEPALGRLAHGRLTHKLHGLIARADVELATLRAAKARAERFVRVRHNGDGTAFIIARTDSVDAHRFARTLDQLADQLALAGDTNEADVRRATAIGILADPDAASNLLAGPEAGSLNLPKGPKDGSLSLSKGAAGSLSVSKGEDRSLSLSEGEDRPLSLSKGRRRRRATAELIIHFAPGQHVGRCEELGPVLAEQVKTWLGHDRVIVRPVIDLADNPAVDSYEIPDAIARIVRLRNPYDIFPFATSPSICLDLDHTWPYSRHPDAPTGQTCPDNLGPTNRRSHRARTHSGWTVTQPFPGTYQWTSRLGYRYHIDQHGTTELPSQPTSQVGRERPDQPGQPPGPDRPPPKPLFTIDYAWTPPHAPAA